MNAALLVLLRRLELWARRKYLARRPALHATLSDALRFTLNAAAQPTTDLNLAYDREMRIRRLQRLLGIANPHDSFRIPMLGEWAVTRDIAESLVDAAERRERGRRP
jgi:hypothetical protein